MRKKYYYLLSGCVVIDTKECNSEIDDYTKASELIDQMAESIGASVKDVSEGETIVEKGDIDETI